MEKKHLMKLDGYVLDIMRHHKSLVTYCEQLPIWNSSVCIPIGNWEVEVIFFIKKIRRIVNKNIKCHTRFDVHWFSINRQKSRPAFTSCWQATTENAIRLLNDEFIIFSPICFPDLFPRIFLSLYLIQLTGTTNFPNSEFQFPQFEVLQSVFILLCVKSYIGIFWCILVWI